MWLIRAIKAYYKWALIFALFVAPLGVCVMLFQGMQTDAPVYEYAVNIIMYLSLTLFLESLALSLIFLILGKKRLSKFFIHRISLAGLFIFLGVIGWGFAFEGLIMAVEDDFEIVYKLTLFEKVIHTIGITAAICGVVAGLITLVEGKPYLAGFCIGLGFALVFVDYFAYGMVLLFGVMQEHLLYVILGIAGFYLLLGVIYTACRFKTIKAIVNKAKRLYWQ